MASGEDLWDTVYTGKPGHGKLGGPECSLLLLACDDIEGQHGAYQARPGSARSAGRPPWPILFMDSALACRRPPPASNASSSKKKDTLLALSRKYWSVLLACGGTGALT